MSKTKTELESDVKRLREQLEKYTNAAYRWEVKEDFVRDRKTGAIFYQADACADCYMPRIIKYSGDEDNPEVIENCVCRMYGNASEVE